MKAMATNVDQDRLLAEYEDLKSQRRYFVRRVESANALNRSQRRYDLNLLDSRIKRHERMIARTEP